MDTKKYLVSGCEVVSRINFNEIKKGDIGYINRPMKKKGKINVDFPSGRVKMNIKDLTNNGYVNDEDRKW